MFCLKKLVVLVVDRLRFYRDSFSSLFLLLSSLLFVSYPTSSLNGTQPNRQHVRKWVRLKMYVRNIWGIPSP